MKKLNISIASLVLTSCSIHDASTAQDRELQKRAANLHLTSAEMDIANALISGFATETGAPVINSRDVGHVLCYAVHVEMPERYTIPHLDYLKNYVEVDKDYYGWFKMKGVPGTDAKAMGDIYLKAFNECKSLGPRVKIFNQIKKERRTAK